MAGGKLQWKNYLGGFKSSSTHEDVLPLSEADSVKLREALKQHLSQVGEARQARRTARTAERSLIPGIKDKKKKPPKVSEAEKSSEKPQAKPKTAAKPALSNPKGLTTGLNSVMRLLEKNAKSVKLVLLCLSVKPLALTSPIVAMCRLHSVPIVATYDLGPMLGAVLGCKLASVAAITIGDVDALADDVLALATTLPLRHLELARDVIVGNADDNADAGTGNAGTEAQADAKEGIPADKSADKKSDKVDADDAIADDNACKNKGADVQEDSAPAAKKAKVVPASVSAVAGRGYQSLSIKHVQLVPKKVRREEERKNKDKAKSKNKDKAKSKNKKNKSKQQSKQ